MPPGGDITYYLYKGNDVIYEETVTSSETFVSSETNILFGGMNFGKYTKVGDGAYIFTYHLLDHLWSRKRTIDTLGVPLDTSATKYKSYGESDEVTNYSFTNKGKDVFGYKVDEPAKTYELVYFNARWYDPELGRFLSEDPVKDGINWYAYCGNDPINQIDPTGLGTLDDYAYQLTTSHSPDAQAAQAAADAEAAANGQGSAWGGYQGADGSGSGGGGKNEDAKIKEILKKYAVLAEVGSYEIAIQIAKQYCLNASETKELIIFLNALGINTQSYSNAVKLMLVDLAQRQVEARKNLNPIESKIVSTASKPFSQYFIGFGKGFIDTAFNPQGSQVMPAIRQPGQVEDARSQGERHGQVIGGLVNALIEIRNNF